MFFISLTEESKSQRTNHLNDWNPILWNRLKIVWIYLFNLLIIVSLTPFVSLQRKKKNSIRRENKNANDKIEKSRAFSETDRIEVKIQKNRFMENIWCENANNSIWMMPNNTVINNMHDEREQKEVIHNECFFLLLFFISRVHIYVVFRNNLYAVKIKEFYVRSKLPIFFFFFFFLFHFFCLLCKQQCVVYYVNGMRSQILCVFFLFLLLFFD